MGIIFKMLKCQTAKGDSVYTMRNDLWQQVNFTLFYKEQSWREEKKVKQRSCFKWVICPFNQWGEEEAGAEKKNPTKATRWAPTENRAPAGKNQNSLPEWVYSAQLIASTRLLTVNEWKRFRNVCSLRRKWTNTSKTWSRSWMNRCQRLLA